MRSSLIHADLMRSNAASRQGADGISTVTPTAQTMPSN
jgi:hypothetical protein